MRVPSLVARMRSTTSSRKPRINERATASMTPSRRSEVLRRPRIGDAGRRQALRRRTRVDDAPPAPGDDLHGGVEGLLRRRRCLLRLDVRIGRVLQLRRIEALIGDRIGVARPQPRDRVELRRIDRIGGDVVDRRQLIGAHAEIGRIGDEGEPDEYRRERLAKSAEAVLPDHDAGPKGQQNGNDRQRQGARKGGNRGNDVERARAHDNDADQRRNEREKRDAARPDGKPRDRLLNYPPPHHGRPNPGYAVLAVPFWRSSA